MPTTELKIRADESAQDARVAAWRFEQLRDAGYDVDAAEELARRSDIDLHVALELVERGCSPDLAIEILR